MRCDRGLTLIELMVATALFALVAVMAAQALGTGLIQRRGIDRAATEAAALARTLALLRQDLEAALPLAHLPAGGARAEPVVQLPGGGFALSRAGLEGGAPQRVTWRIDHAREALVRESAPLVGAVPDPGQAEALLPGATALRLVLLGDVPAGGLPAGFEATIDTRSRGSLRVVVAR